MAVTYTSVLVALYDYTPPAGADDEVAIKEDQVLLLLDSSDDEWWKVKVKTNSQEDNGDSGLVPKAYVEEAKVLTSAKALYDYTANGDGELTIAEDELLSVYDQEEEWSLVKSNKPGGKAGYVPATYIELSGSVQKDEDEEAEAPAPVVAVPAAAPRSSYSDPSELVAASHTKARNDPVETWSVSILDKKDKKKKGTLGVGNGSIFFASESDKTPVQQWQSAAVATVTSERAKHVDIQIASGSEVTTLRFVAGSRDVSDAIMEKVESSRLIATGGSAAAQASSSASAEPTKSHKNGASVRFAQTPDSVIPSPVEDEEGPDGEQASALYDFQAQAPDELSVKEGETLIVINREESEEWWKCKNMKGEEGVVPSSYIELGGGSGSAARTQSQDDDDDTVEEMATAKAAEQQAAAMAEKRRLEQVKEREEAERRAADEKRRKREQERAEAEAKARELESMEVQRLEKEKTAKQAARASTASRPSTDSEPRRSNAGPRPSKTRVWHDRTGQFKVEAEFLGIENGKIKLHKTNGVIIDVPSAKMSPEDMAYVEKLINSGKRPATGGDDDNVPLSVIAERRNSRPPSAAQRPAPQQPKKPQIDWFDFFLNAGCDMDDCTRYASSFNRDKIDESIVGDIKDSTLRSLGLREGDIIRVLKAIEKRGWKHEDDSARREQVRKDEELARQLQAQENAAAPRRSATTSPAPNLFTGPNGTLKNQTRRGRPPPSSKTAPLAVDATALASSGSISRGNTPQITNPPGGNLTSSPTEESRPAPAAPAPAPVISGFDDDAWTPRPSSTKPASPAPAVALSPPPAPPAPAPASPAPAPPAPTPAVAAPTPAVAPVAPAPPPAPPAPPAPSPAIQRPATANPSTISVTASQPASSQFDILAKIEQMRPPSAPVISQPTGIQGIQASAPVPSGFQAGLGMGNSPMPVGQLLTAQQTGMLGPRQPPAPIPANQALLAPLIPTTTGFNSFVPTRPGSTPTFGGLQSQPTGFRPSQPSFLQTQPTGFQPSQPSFLPSQPTGFQPTQPSFLASQPTGFQPSQPSFLQSQPTGFQPSQAPSMGLQPTGMGMFNGGGLQPQPTGLQMQPNSFNSPPSNAPPQNNLSAANVFASMKAGTFAGGAGTGPQSADKYDVLRQPTGANNFMVPQQTGFGFQPQQQFQPGFNGYQ